MNAEGQAASLAFEGPVSHAYSLTRETATGLPPKVAFCTLNIHTQVIFYPRVTLMLREVFTWGSAD